jgi:hypothetical protein
MTPLRQSSIVICILLLTGCAITPLSPPEPLPNIEQLASVNTKPIMVSVASKVSEQDDVGSQYLLIAIPFGRVQMQKPETHVGIELYEQLAIRGFVPILEKVENPQIKHLHVVIERVDVTAYDFILGRRVSATVQLKVGLYTPTLGQFVYVPIQETTGEFRKYGFQQQLEKALRECIHKAVLGGLNALNFPPPPRQPGRLHKILD